VTGFNVWDHIPPAMADQMVREDARAQRQMEMEAAERAERAWFKREEAVRQEAMLVYTTGHGSDVWRQAAALAREAREQYDPAAEVGSVGRAAIFGPDGDLLNDPARQVRRVSQASRMDDLLAANAQLVTRARQSPVLQQEIRDRTRRPGGGHVIARSTGGSAPECLNCIEQGATAEESFLLHSDPEVPVPVRTVPDHPPASRKRSGTGWPELVR
jgi:hypothetical protein